MPICSNCGEENLERARFCLSCGTPLRAVGAPTEERKVVTVLFCDLVGFTARSDKADPEDVKAALRPFHTRIKREIEAYGGTLDKFIGDAALGVFGSPVAHEDDPERAVRAALAIAGAIGELNEADPSLNLAVRVGVNTGEAVVAYGFGPQIGEAVTGDVVNTASRLQGVAPVGGIVVGEATYRATGDAVVYEPLPPVTVKGKVDPLRIWRAVEARARLGVDVTRTHATAFVGRELERRRLLGTYQRAVSDDSVQLVIVAGEAGIGKSRLVSEIGRHLDESPDLVTWRQGRCLPYGEGITFWALGEIVKAHAGILESDTAEAVAAKLDAVVAEGEPDRQWLRQRLAPLVGAETSAVADREESFTAWRRFLESIASRGPAVFVFEDLHWADQAMLAFLEHLADWSEGVPMLLVCTARPELYERQRTWAAAARNVTRINLSPLDAGQTATLVSSMLQDAELTGEVHDLILERSGGNPLYAEELVRMLKERELLVTTGQTVALTETAGVFLPASIQAIMAARLDAVTPERKGMLQDGAVIGKVFWSGAVAAMAGRDERSVTAALHELSRRHLVRPARTSSMKGQAEYAFWHSLLRDVAYAQIPRASRATRHRAAAAWIERVAAERVEDHAEVLAHHYTQALELALAAGSARQAEEIQAPALRFLLLAGDRALGLDVATAEAHYTRALALVPPGHQQRSTVLAKWADAARQLGRFPQAAQALEEAIDGFRARGDRLAAGRAMGTLSSVLLGMGNQRQAEVAADAVRLLESEPAGPDLLAAYARMAGAMLVQGDMRATIAWGDRAMALAADRGLQMPARALGFRGYGRCSLGDVRGLEDMRTALTLAIDRGEGRDAAVLYNNLAAALLPVEGPASALATNREGIEFAERRGIKEFTFAMAAANLEPLVDLGEWDEVLEAAAAMTGQAEATGDVADLLQVRWAQARVLTGRGEAQAAAPLADWLVAAARESGGTEDVTAGFAAAAGTYLALGEPQRALRLLAEVERWPHARESPTYPAYLPEMVRGAVAAGDLALAERLAAGLAPVFAHHRHALCAADAILAEAREELEGAAGRYAEAAERWGGFGVLPERGHALLGRGRCLLALGSPAAREPLRQARAVFVRLGAHPLVAQTHDLLEPHEGG
jgi:class 3 adenylate cyclase/tetratricopeptide (TPR) repeat protein